MWKNEKHSLTTITPTSNSSITTSKFMSYPNSRNTMAWRNIIQYLKMWTYSKTLNIKMKTSNNTTNCCKLFFSMQLHQTVPNTSVNSIKPCCSGPSPMMLVPLSLLPFKHCCSYLYESVVWNNKTKQAA